MKKAYLKDIIHILVIMNIMIHFLIKKTLRHQMSRIRSKKHELVIYISNKISISCFDDKHYILSDGINTLPYGQKDIPKIE